MIAYRVFIKCNGDCGRELERSFTARDPQYLAELARELSQFTEPDGWTIDGDAHWCPKCTRQRAELPGSPRHIACRE
jgi:hypothetical protein